MITIPEYSHKIWQLLRFFEFNKSEIRYDLGNLRLNYPPTLYYKGVSARFLIDTDNEFINTDFCKCIISRNRYNPENSTEEDFSGMGKLFERFYNGSLACNGCNN